MELMKLYDIFSKWLDPNARGRSGFILVENAPQEAIDALEEYRRIQEEANKRGAYY